MLRVAAVFLIAGLAGTPIQQTTNPAADSAREQDVYTVYSALLSNPPIVGGTSNQTYAIASTSLPLNMRRAEDPSLPEGVRTMLAGCDAPPAELGDRWQEILADFRSRSDAPVPLARELKISKPYVFLSVEEVTAFMSFRTSINTPPAPNPQFGGAVSVISLSNVYFNKDRTLAVVRISSACGTLCGQGERKVFEKTTNGWREVMTDRRCVVTS